MILSFLRCAWKPGGTWRIIPFSILARLGAWFQIYIGNWKIRVNLVGGFTNPFEKYAARQIGSSTQVKGENSKKSLSCHHLAMVNKGLIRPYFWGMYVKGGLVD